jgi:hypothetical protein
MEDLVRQNVIFYGTFAGQSSISIPISNVNFQPDTLRITGITWIDDLSASLSFILKSDLVDNQPIIALPTTETMVSANAVLSADYDVHISKYYKTDLIYPIRKPIAGSYNFTAILFDGTGANLTGSLAVHCEFTKNKKIAFNYI